MAMNKAQAKTDVVAAIKTAFNSAYGEPEASYDEFANIMADTIVDIIIQHILDNAETSVDAESIL